MSYQESDIIPERPSKLDMELFYELISTRKFTSHYISQADSPNDPLYCVKNHNSVLKQKHDVVLHNGNSEAGAVLGVVKLNLRDHAIGIGNPETLLEEDDIDGRMIWERLRRSNKWNHKAYEFDYEGGAGGNGRMKYKWEWVEPSRLGVSRKLELRAGSLGDDMGNDVGSVVAIFNRTDWKFKKSGSLFIKKIQSGNNDEQDKNWKLIVLMTVLAILESSVRRD